MEAIIFLFLLAIVFLFLSGALKVIWWVISAIFQVGCFIAALAIFGFIFLFLMVGCLASLA
jgi:hypothetical protein